MSTFYSPQRGNSGIKTPICLHEKNTGYQWVLMFSVDVHMELNPSLNHMHPPENDPPQIFSFANTRWTKNCPCHIK